MSEQDQAENFKRAIEMMRTALLTQPTVILREVAVIVTSELRRREDEERGPGSAK
jgi:hypothetical protein